MKNKLKQLLSNNVVRNITILVGGTAFSQLVAILILPLLTRLYTPSDFGVLAVYIAVLTIISSIACLRLEIAVPLPKSDEVAIRLVVLSLLSTLIITVIVLIVILCFSARIHLWSGSKLEGYLWLIPIGVLGTGAYSALQYWSTRKKKFKIIARTRMTQSISGAGIQVGLGFLGVAPVGLIVGQVAQNVTGVYGLAVQAMRDIWPRLKTLRLNDLNTTFRAYSHFPKYSTWEALANSGAIQLPVIVIAALTAGMEAGYIMLAMRLLSAPMGLIGGAVAQVYLSEAPARKEAGDLGKFTVNMIAKLAKVGFGPLLFAGMLAPFLISLIFGASWERAGDLISWMAPWFFVQFIASPVSMSLHIIGRQKAALVLQIIGLVFRTGVVLMSGLYFQSWVGEAYAVSGFIFYLFYLAIILYMIKVEGLKRV